MTEFTVVRPLRNTLTSFKMLSLRISYHLTYGLWTHRI